MWVYLVYSSNSASNCFAFWVWSSSRSSEFSRSFSNNLILPCKLDTSFSNYSIGAIKKQRFVQLLFWLRFSVCIKMHSYSKSKLSALAYVVTFLIFLLHLIFLSFHLFKCSISLLPQSSHLFLYRLHCQQFRCKSHYFDSARKEKLATLTVSVPSLLS